MGKEGHSVLIATASHLKLSCGSVFQKIISDRVDFHHLLKQKGVKVPPLNSNEPIIIPTHKKKSSSKQGLGAS